MKRVRAWIPAAFLFSFLLPAASTAQTEETLFLVAAKESRVQAQPWIDFLQRYDLPVEHYVLSELDLVKKHDFVTVAGGLDEDGVRELLAQILGEAGLASLESEETGKMILKENVWKEGQKVLIFAGRNAAAAAAARSESREAWMECLTDWFDLQDVPGGLKAY
ncbi:MAG: hypothetical protein JW793_09470 [Acidobacteria bacterium]|nr:hypothetical protein [Acidobacteriota bacterium]